jgi:hypothetical protein
LSAQKDAPTQMGVRYNSAMVWQFLKSLWLILCGTCPLHGEPLDNCAACDAILAERNSRRSLWE